MAAAKHDGGDGNVESLHFFAALPGRVTSDRRLTALHFRLLATIAGFDRMGRNGRCCFAGPKTLAGLIGCAEGSFRNAASELVAMGYLRVERSDEDARRAGYAVVYDMVADAAGIGAKIKANVSSGDDRKRGRNVSSIDDRLPRDTSSPDDRISRDVSSNDVVFGNKKVPKDKVNQLLKSSVRNPNIFCETENINTKARERLEIAERLLGSGRALEALPEIAQIPDETWAIVEKRWRAGTLSEGELMVAIEDGRRILALRAAGGGVANAN